MKRQQNEGDRNGSAETYWLRVGIGGIAIESSTFSPYASTIDDFEILRGSEMEQLYPFLDGWRLPGFANTEWVPIFRARSLPGGPVIADDYARMKKDLLDGVRATLPLDGFFFHIHGAMSVVGMQDAEGDLAVELRKVVGPRCLISAAMDLHGNVSERLVENVNLLTAYRTAPHEDVDETGERACRNLLSCLRRGVRPLRAWVRIPVILPGERTSTRVEPALSIYRSLVETEAMEGIIDASLWVGYVWADEPRSSATVVVSGTDAGALQRQARLIARRYWDAREQFGFGVPAGDADWCISEGLARGHHGVLISDSGDNPTAGGAGDITYFTSRLLSHPALADGSRSAIHASVVAEEAVNECRRVGLGGSVEVRIGGVLDPLHGNPIDLRGIVDAFVENDRIGGAMAVVRSGGVSVILTSRRKPFHHLSDFKALGWEISEKDLTIVKIGYLEPELHQAARYAFLALSPGAVNQDIARLHYDSIVRPMYPLDPVMSEPALEAKLFEV